MTQSDNKEPLDSETSSEWQVEIEAQLDPETSSGWHTVPPIAQKVSRFGPQSGSRFGKWAMNFNPPNKQRPGRAAGRGR